jgi:hypothetical protein
MLIPEFLRRDPECTYRKLAGDSSAFPANFSYSSISARRCCLTRGVVASASSVRNRAAARKYFGRMLLNWLIRIFIEIGHVGALFSLSPA